MDIFSETTLTPGEEEGTYDVRLSLSLTGAVAVIVLDFFRLRPALRFAAGILGIPLMLGGAWAIMSVSFDWWDVALYGALLSGASVFSSGRFNVYMAEVEAPEAVEGIDDSGTGALRPGDKASALLEAARQEAEDGLEQSQSVARSRFQWGLLTLVIGVTAFGAGLLTLLAGGTEVAWRAPFWTGVGMGLSALAGGLLHASGKARKAAAYFRRQVDRLRDLEIALSLDRRDSDEDGWTLGRSRVLDLLLGPREGEGLEGAWLPAAGAEGASGEG